MQRKRFTLKSLIIEIATIVLGVLIAVSINNFKEQLNNKNYIKKTLLAIEKEIQVSKSDVDRIMNRHLAIIDSLESDFEAYSGTLGEMVSSLGGIQSPSIKNISLRFFVSNKAELVPFETISQLLEIEGHSEALDKKMERLIDFSYKNINEKDDDTKIRFAYYLANVIDSEQALLKSYDNFINENRAFLVKANND